MSNVPSSELISAYADNQLSDQERQEVDALLQSSPEARAELESYRKLGSILKKLPEQPASADLAQRVLAQAETESLLGKSQPASEINTAAVSASNRRWSISMAAFLATAALLFFALTQFQPSADRSPSVAMNDSSSESVSEMELMVEEEMTADLSESDAGMAGARLPELMDGPDRMSVEFGNKGMMKLVDPQNLKTAEIGDTVEGWRFDEDRVVVVQLTVVDRDEVLNSMQVLLSDLSIPYESENQSSPKDENGDFYAVYVEADTDKMTAALRELQEDMNIEEMLVAANVDSTDLNPYFKEQGYAYTRSEGLNKTKSTARMSIPAEPAATPLRSKSPKPAREITTEAKPATLAETAPAVPFDKSENSKLSAVPPAPPLPEEKSTLSFAKSASPESYRQLQIRLPESVANQMIFQKQSDKFDAPGQHSVSNSFATEHAKELNKSLAAKTPDSAPIAGRFTHQKENLLDQRSMSRNSPMPVQVLFVFTPEPKAVAPASKVPNRK